MLERRDDYASLYRDFRWIIPRTFQHRRRGRRPLGGRRSGPDRSFRLSRRRRAGPAELFRTSPPVERLRQRLAGAAALAAATGSRCSCRRCFETVIAHLAIYKLGAIAVPLALLFGVEALEYRLQTAGVKLVVTNAAGAAKVVAHRRTPARPRRDGGRRRRRGPGRFRPTGGRPLAGLRRRRHRPRRSGADDLHLRHDRPAQGRAAAAPRAARPSARRADGL